MKRMTTIQILINYLWFNGAVRKINTKKRQTVCNGPHWSNNNIHNIWSRLNRPAGRKTVWLEFIFVINTSMAPNNVEIIKISMAWYWKAQLFMFCQKIPDKTTSNGQLLTSQHVDRSNKNKFTVFFWYYRKNICLYMGRSTIYSAYIHLWITMDPYFLALYAKWRHEGGIFFIFFFF